MSSPCGRGEQQLLFVLDALDGPERAAFAEHMAGCDHCTQAVHAARDVLEEEAPSVPQDAASLDRVRARLRERVRGGSERNAPRRPQSASLLRPALAAGVAAALVGAVGWLLHSEDLERLEAAQHELGERVTALEQQASALASERDELAARLELARREADLLRAEHLVVVVLAPIAQTSDAHGRIFWDPPTLRCYLLARGLAPLAGDRRYALWVFTESGAAILAGSFSADTAGRGSLYAELPPAAAEKIDRVVLTDEPARVGAEPTGAEHLIWLRPL